jgi:hypothetical protein
MPEAAVALRLGLRILPWSGKHTWTCLLLSRAQVHGLLILWLLLLALRFAVVLCERVRGHALRTFAVGHVACFLP